MSQNEPLTAILGELKGIKSGLENIKTEVKNLKDGQKTTDTRLQRLETSFETEAKALKADRKIANTRLQGLKTSFEDETDMLREQIASMEKGIKEQNIEFKDEILGEVKAMREELAVALEQYRRHEDTLTSHETRLGKLETTSLS